MATTLEELDRRLRAMDGRGYGAYKGIAGRYRGRGFELCIDRVQGDPFAAPSRLRARLSREDAALPPAWTSSATRRVALADLLHRSFLRALHSRASRRGSGRSGGLDALRPAQEVLERSAMVVADDGRVEARFTAGLPAAGRRVLGREAAEFLTGDVPHAVAVALRADALDVRAVEAHLAAVEDARALRDQLAAAGLVAFVADGSLLPRASGVDDRPLDPDRARLCTAPESLRVTLRAPQAGAVHGLGVPRGVTLVVGGGYHGKSTLLRAIERGVYDHIPGDGRERVVTDASAVKVRAEDGRSVAGTDISNFIDRLPEGVDTTCFTTVNASGSTSQAATIAEAIACGCRCLLVDEDTSATNFLIRDARMQALVAREHEPITPFIDRARELFEELGVSTVLVVGGAGDYFEVADTIIAMREYVPCDVTAEAKRIAAALPSRRHREGARWRPLRAQAIDPRSVDPRRGRREVHVKLRGERRLSFGEEEIDLTAVEQIVEEGQVRALGRCLAWAARHAIDGRRTFAEVVEVVDERLAGAGLEGVLPSPPAGDLARIRPAELAAGLARLRSLRTLPAP